MQKFTTFALLISALVAVGNCVEYGHPGYARQAAPASAAASSAAADTAQVIAPAKVYAHPPVHRPAYPAVHRPVYPAVHRPAYPAVHRPIYPAVHHAAYPAVHRPAYPAVHRPAYPAVHRPAYPVAQPYGQPAVYHQPKTSVLPAGAALLYPGQNSYKSYDSPPLYSKVILPVRPAAPVANLYVPEARRYGVAY